MSFCQCECPACQNGIGFKPPKLGTVRLTCPKCSHQFLYEVVVEPAASDAFLQQLSSAPVQTPPRLEKSDGYLNHSHASNLYRKRSKVFVPILLAFLGTFGLGMTILVVAVVIYLSGRAGDLPFPTRELSGSRLESVLPLGIAFDSLQRVQADIDSECNRIEAVGTKIASDDQSQQTADAMKASSDKLFQLTLRGCRLMPVATKFEELLIPAEPFVPLSQEQRQKLAGMKVKEQRAFLQIVREDFRNKAFEPHPFWRVDGAAGDDRPVTQAINELTQSRAAAYLALHIVVELPSPFSRAADQFNWSDEERVLVATSYIQGRLSRDFLHAFAGVESPTPSQATLKSIHAAIDRYTAEANELRKRITWKNRWLVHMPKNNPYSLPQATAQWTYQRVKAPLLALSNDKQLEFVCKDYEQVLDAIDELKLDPSFLFTNSSYGRYQDWVKEEKRKQDLILAQLDAQNQRADQQKAEAEQKERDQANERLAAAERQRKSVEESAAAQRRAEEDRRRALEDQMAAQNAIADAQRNSPTGAPPGFGPRGFGGPPPGFGNPGFGRGPGFQPPASMETPNANNQNVVIQVAKVKFNDSMLYSQKLPKDLLKYNPTVNISNGAMKLSLQRFNQPLDSLRALLPFLIIERIDEKNRVVVARETN
jgi:hypothetical protein